MKMTKQKLVLLVAIVAMIGGFIWLKQRGIRSQSTALNTRSPEPDRTEASPPSTVQSSQGASAIPTQDTTSSITATPNPQRAELRRQFVERMKADPNYIFKASIRFYGKVLDETEQPVSQAAIDFSWNRLNSAGQVEGAKTGAQTDAQGLFSLEGQTGSGLCVMVNKPGYYAVRSNPSCFDYSQPYAANFHIPDPINPVVFHLRQKGHGVPLVTSANGLRNNLKLPIPTDGAPVKVDLLQQKVLEAGPLEISQSKPSTQPWQEATQWSFKMTIPDGGFIEHHDEFPFEAPQAGYEPTVELHFQKDQSNWATGVTKDYYIRFGNPPLYGRLRLQTSIDERGARLTYAVNPDGSRNLEPQ